jgi:hypothetical protein
MARFSLGLLFDVVILAMWPVHLSVEYPVDEEGEVVGFMLW